MTFHYIYGDKGRKPQSHWLCDQIDKDSWHQTLDTSTDYNIEKLPIERNLKFNIGLCFFVN